MPSGNLKKKSLAFLTIALVLTGGPVVALLVLALLLLWSKFVNDPCIAMINEVDAVKSAPTPRFPTSTPPSTAPPFAFLP